jgi:GNAT superfamily N-acetyltransferase
MLLDRSGVARVGEEVDVGVERWVGGELPEPALDILRDGLRELGETEDDLFMTLDHAASERNLTFVASEGGRPVGVLLALPKPRSRSAFVLWLIVTPDARRRGVGTALVDALEATPGIERLDGMVDQEDPTALGFWRGRGWTVSEPRPGRRRQTMAVELAAAAPAAVAASREAA